MQLEFEIISRLGDVLNRRILDATLPGSGNMKAQHIGIFWTIFFETNDGSFINTQELAELMNLAQSAVLAATARLLALSLIKRQKSQTQNTKGRKIYEYAAALPADIAHDVIQKELLRPKSTGETRVEGT